MKRAQRWLAALVLLLPAAGLYASHFAHARSDPQKVATGFLVYDMPYYLANARELFDPGSLHASYGNPFSPAPETPRIYFQPMTLLYGLTWQWTGLDPGTVFLAFGLLFGVLWLRLVIEAYEEWVGLGSRLHWLGLVCFVWGGGLLAAAGTAAAGPGGLLRFDPSEGWWCLNLGRNLVLPTEALYHALAFGCILALVRERFALAFAALALLSASHPFAGIQFLLIVSAWSFQERWLQRNTSVPPLLLAGCAVLTVLHLAYYLFFLPSFEEHASVMQQWTLPYNLDWQNMLPAYALVGGLALFRVRSAERAKRLLAEPQQRLLLAWFGVTFLLANHEWFITARQPIHFTRGHIWTPLFLLGGPTLLALFAWLRGRSARALGVLGPAAVCAVLLADNALWLRHQARQPTGIYLTPAAQRVFEDLSQREPRDRGALVVSNNESLSYLAMTYTPLRAWMSHWAVTPFAEQRRAEVEAYFQKGELPEAWLQRRLYVIVEYPGRAPERPEPPPGGVQEVQRSGNLVVFRRDPRP